MLLKEIPKVAIVLKDAFCKVLQAFAGTTILIQHLNKRIAIKIKEI